MSLDFPRIERNVDGRLIINIGPYGGMATYAAMMYLYLPETWPKEWPEDGVISWSDPRVAAACSGLPEVSERPWIYYEEVTLEGQE